MVTEFCNEIFCRWFAVNLYLTVDMYLSLQKHGKICYQISREYNVAENMLQYHHFLVVGFTSMLPLFSAPLADAYWDRFFTILASSSVYFVVRIFFFWNATSLNHQSSVVKPLETQLRTCLAKRSATTFLSRGIQTK